MAGRNDFLETEGYGSGGIEKKSAVKKKSTKKAGMKKAGAKKSAERSKSAAKRKKSPKSKKSPARRAVKKTSPRDAGSENGSLMDLIVDHSPDGIVAVDQKGIIRYVNAIAEDLLKDTAGNRVGQKFGLPVDTHRPQDVSISGKDHRETVAEIRARETKMGQEKFFIVSLRDVTERAHLEAQLRALSDVDPLTGLLNRRGFLEAAKRQLNLAQRQNWGMTLFFLDLDGLKWINDEFGHLEGDQALIETATILRKTVRGPDIIGRFAGDEFTVLAFEGTERSDSSIKIASRLRKNLEEHNARKRVDRKISFSIGVASFDPVKSPSLEVLIDEADFKMYEEKRQKRRSR
jgi:diguanylate cyclase (GGDEF)-like protein